MSTCYLCGQPCGPEVFFWTVKPDGDLYANERAPGHRSCAARPANWEDWAIARAVALLLRGRP